MAAREAIGKLVATMDQLWSAFGGAPFSDGRR